jgi:hypothetical protein
MLVPRAHRKVVAFRFAGLRPAGDDGRTRAGSRLLLDFIRIEQVGSSATDVSLRKLVARIGDAGGTAIAMGVAAPMLTTLRLIVHDGPHAFERRFLKLPVHIGRGPGSNCVVFDTEVSRSHATLDVEDAEIILRDVGSQNGTHFTEGGISRCLRGAEARFAGGRAEFMIGRVRVAAVLEYGAPVASGLASALRSAAGAILGACEPALLHPLGDLAATATRVHEVLDVCFANILSVRLAVLGAGVAGGAGAGGGDEVAAALLHWTQAALVALRVLEHGVQAIQADHDRLATDAVETVETLLRELAPERLERGTSDVCTEWPAARASAVWARYKTLHEKLAARHARRPSLLLSPTLGRVVDARRSRPDGRVVTQPLPISERRPKAVVELHGDRPTDPADAPPSSE